ncbi:MAG TPA: ATP phosphoribosyltransferase regulatory subunit, partial [Cyanobacteria bacterium UBA11368]|nr:ATP phosphoribosyltransferase regulatory subunit [Cyanobacteria bacterium UBA11368]
ILQQVGTLELDLSGQEALSNLKSLVELLQECLSDASGHGAALNIILDLSLIQTFDYYTGIVFEVVGESETGQRILGQGGRYDRLLQLYHPQGENVPGIGFCLNIEDLYQILLPTGQLPRQIPTSDFLVVPQTSQADAAAINCAQKLRSEANLVRVELDLGGRPPDAIREYARRRQIGKIIWVKPDGSSEIEALA